MASFIICHGQAPVQAGNEHRAEHADGAAFGRRGPAGEDRADHDHHQRRHGKQAPPHRRPELAAGLRPVVRRQLGRHAGLQHGDPYDVEQVQPREHEAGHGGREKQRPGRGREHLRHHHQHDCRRDEDAERSGRGDGADGQSLVVARRQHLRQRDHRERDHRRADHADRRGQDGSHHHDGARQRARDPLQQHFRRLQHVHRRAGSLQDRPHEDEHGNRREHRIDGHATPHAQHDVVEADHREHAEQRAHNREEQRHPAHDERHGVAAEDHEEHHREHDQSQVVGQPVEHDASLDLQCRAADL